MENPAVKTAVGAGCCSSAWGCWLQLPQPHGEIALGLDASFCPCARAGSFLPWGIGKDAPGQVGEEERVEAGNVAPSWLPTCCGKHGFKPSPTCLLGEFLQRPHQGDH